MFVGCCFLDAKITNGKKGEMNPLQRVNAHTLCGKFSGVSLRAAAAAMAAANSAAEIGVGNK